jgi:hypothetical protein
MVVWTEGAASTVAVEVGAVVVVMVVVVVVVVVIVVVVMVVVCNNGGFSIAFRAFGRPGNGEQRERDRDGLLKWWW